MSTVEVRSGAVSGTASASGVEMKLEVVVIPVSDVDCAKAFYAGLGWRVDADFADGQGFRIVQFTPPGSACSIQFGASVTTAPPDPALSRERLFQQAVERRAFLGSTEELRRLGGGDTAHSCID
jgi:hypothetical protein